METQRFCFYAKFVSIQFFDNFPKITLLKILLLELFKKMSNDQKQTCKFIVVWSLHQIDWNLLHRLLIKFVWATSTRFVWLLEWNDGLDWHLWSMTPFKKIISLFLCKIFKHPFFYKFHEISPVNPSFGKPYSGHLRYYVYWPLGQTLFKLSYQDLDSDLDLDPLVFWKARIGHSK